jgi:hypothetical protein
MVTDSQTYGTLVVPTNFYYFVSDVTDAVLVVRALVEDLRRDADSDTEPGRAARRPHELLPLSSHVAALGALRVLASAVFVIRSLPRCVLYLASVSSIRSSFILFIYHDL